MSVFRPGDDAMLVLLAPHAVGLSAPGTALRSSPLALCVRTWPALKMQAAYEDAEVLRTGKSFSEMNSESAKVLSTSSIAEMLEASFVRACMDVARGYVDTLKLFIVAAKAGFEIGSTISDVSVELQACVRQTAGRPLLEEEEKLRHMWTCLVYLTLAQVSHPTKGADVGDSVGVELRKKYTPMVEGVVSAHTNGRTLPSLELCEFLKPPADAVEKAVLSQSMRLIFLTLVVLEEERGAVPIKPPGTGAVGGPKAGGPPQPYIPGTS